MFPILLLLLNAVITIRQVLPSRLQQTTRKKQPYEKTQNLYVFYRTVSKPFIQCPYFSSYHQTSAHHAQQSSQTSSARPNHMDVVGAHQRPLRTVERAQLSYSASAQSIIPGCGRAVQVPEGYVYAAQYTRACPGSVVLCRNALTHSVEINTKFMLSQIRI